MHHMRKTRETKLKKQLMHFGEYWTKNYDANVATMRKSLFSKYSQSKISDQTELKKKKNQKSWMIDFTVMNLQSIKKRLKKYRVTEWENDSFCLVFLNLNWIQLKPFRFAMLQLKQLFGIIQWHLIKTQHNVWRKPNKAFLHNMLTARHGGGGVVIQVCFAATQLLHFKHLLAEWTNVF